MQFEVPIYASTANAQHLNTNSRHIKSNCTIFSDPVRYFARAILKICHRGLLHPFRILVDHKSLPVGLHTHADLQFTQASFENSC